MDNFDLGLQIWTLLTFCGLFILLAKYAFEPLKKILHQREERIEASLESAERAKSEAERILKENEHNLNEAREETRNIINEGHRIVSEMKKEAEALAKRNADVMVARAKADIEREVQNSMDNLKTTIANISVNISRQFIKETLDEKKHEHLADEFIERLKKTNAGRK